jgi:hypothetical protein
MRGIFPRVISFKAKLRKIAYLKRDSLYLKIESYSPLANNLLLFLERGHNYD